jgi:ADP-heptose:LPS heptosyltransferase
MLKKIKVFSDTYDKISEITMPTSAKLFFKLLSVIIKLRQSKFDLGIVTFPSFSLHYNLLNFLIGAKQRIGFKFPDDKYSNLSFLNNHRLPVVVGLHDVKQNNNLVKFVGEKEVAFPDLAAAQETFKKKKLPIIGVHTGCKAGYEYKQWGLDRFAAVIEKIIEADTAYALRLYFGPDELAQIDYFKKRPWFKKIQIITGLNLEETVSSIEECTAFLSNDSGLMHIAVLTGCPNVIAIGGPSDERRTGPYDQRAKIITSELSCRPCSHSYNLSSRSFNCSRENICECLEKITAEQVVDAVLDSLKTLN